MARIDSTTSLKTCRRCGQSKPLTEFFRLVRPTRSATHRPHCKRCHNLGRAPEKPPVLWRRLTYRLRAGGRRSPSTAALQDALGHPTACSLCGGRVDWDTAVLDHVVPTSRGGTNDVQNLRWAHRACNTIKGDLLIPEMIATIRQILDYHSET